MKMTFQVKRLLLAAFFVVAMALLWRLFDPITPLVGTYFVVHRTLPDLYNDLNLLPAVAGILMAENAHDPSEFVIWLVFVLQWGVLGYGMGALIFRKPN